MKVEEILKYGVDKDKIEDDKPKSKRPVSVDMYKKWAKKRIETVLKLDKIKREIYFEGIKELKEGHDQQNRRDRRERGSKNTARVPYYLINNVDLENPLRRKQPNGKDQTKSTNLFDPVHDLNLIKIRGEFERQRQQKAMEKSYHIELWRYKTQLFKALLLPDLLKQIKSEHEDNILAIKRRQKNLQRWAGMIALRKIMQFWQVNWFSGKATMQRKMAQFICSKRI